MNFRIADTFRASLAKLNAQEQKAAKTTAFDLQVDPSHPALKFHRIEKSKDSGFWSVRVSGDIRIVVHKTKSDFLLCYVDHHDKAYEWAVHRRLETHPKTGAVQLVEIRELVKEVPVYRKHEIKPAPTAKTPALAGADRDILFRYGVPEDWIDAVLAADEDELLEIAPRLPQEAAEAVLDLAVGATPEVVAMPSGVGGFEHPDAQRRFRLFTDEEELARALEYPWEQWTVFLHPSQKRFVEQEYSGPARVTGSAGTGKTVVALHRAVHLAKQFPNSQILLTTFSRALADLLRVKMNRLAGGGSPVAKRITVLSLQDVATELYSSKFGALAAAEAPFVRSAIDEAIQETGSSLSSAFVWSEWRFVIDAWQVDSFKTYQSVPRVGRKTRLGTKQRERVWAVCSSVRSRLEASKKVTWARAFARITESLRETGDRPYDFVIVDESQDLGVPELRLLAVLGDKADQGLFFAGDSGQRIFQQPFSWKALGVDIRGRSNRLRINYRTTRQIRSKADILLPDAVSDVDGNVEERRGTISVFEGVEPKAYTHESNESEIDGVASIIANALKGEIQPEELAIFVRSAGQMPRARAALKRAGAGWSELEHTSLAPAGKVALSTMHLAKGLEFRVVIIMACDYDVIPLAKRIESAADESELEEFFNTERHLLYVAATRARERLLLSGVRPISEFLEDMGIATCR